MFAALIVSSGRWVSADRLAEFVWPSPPESVGSNLRTHVTALRRSLESISRGLSNRIETARGAGFRLRIMDGEVDSQLLVDLAAHGNRDLRASRYHRAAELLTRGLRLWHGPLGVDLPDTVPFRERFDELYRVHRLARADLCEARLRLAEAALTVGDLYELMAESPLSERPVALLMEALAASGSAVVALTEYDSYRRLLADEIGVHPSPHLESLYLQILRSDGGAGRSTPPLAAGTAGTA